MPTQIRKKKKDKRRERFEKFGKYTTKHVRQQEERLYNTLDNIQKRSDAEAEKEKIKSNKKKKKNRK